MAARVRAEQHAGRVERVSLRACGRTRGVAPLRQAILQAARGLGVEGPLRFAQQGLESPLARRNRRDDEHLRLLLAFALGADSNCVDVGANVGGVLAEIVHFAPHGRHIAYEPLPDLRARLAERFPEVDVRAAALSDRAGEAEFVRVKGAASRSGFCRIEGHGRGEERITVATESLDAALPEGYVPAVIKIDVEGAEQQVLEGALETLRRHRPIVVLEHGSAARAYGTAPADIHALLCDRAGLRIFDMDGGGPYSLAEFQRIWEGGTRWNFVAHP